ncbi:MAG: DUF262 domain-containing protein, partial [Devosiaceae bacterium]|nr:DUF262 domain-containing protein [Devosiaceae bacterium]
MKASAAGLLEFLEKSTQFIIPIYQRTYSWTEKECEQLWNDILRTGRDDKINVHFVGSIVYIEEGLSQISTRSPVLVIDGQQRLTTITLLLAALSRTVGDSEPLKGFSASKIHNRYLVDEEEEDDLHYKLLLTKTDKETLKAVVSGKEYPTECSIRISSNFDLFTEWLKKHSKELDIVCKGLSKLVVVDIALTRDQDNPQLIFESMNSTGKELSQADLIRNFILMGLEPKLQSDLYKDYWRPMEVEFGQEAYTSHFDNFMRHYLTFKTGAIPKLDGIYEAFKDYSRTPEVKGDGIEELVRDVRSFTRYYCAMALGTEKNDSLKTAFHDLRELKVDVAYPFLLELYQDYDKEILSTENFEEVVRLIESYVFRRAICAIPTNSLNKTFSTFTKALRKDCYMESIKAHFLKLPSYRRFPSDDEFRRDIQTRDLYNFRSRSFWLRRLENHGRKERAPVDEYTIEHIMPQNPDLSPAWQTALGENYKAIQETWLHTLGNLTLTGYNSEYSDKPFKDKRDMEGGFGHSPLKVNDGLGWIKVWNEKAIKARAGRLASEAIKVWKSPQLPEGVLDKYSQKKVSLPSYSIEDHHHLHGSEMRELFNALRREILALDPCVNEEFLKLYVAYKAETNFVDIVPQAKQLRLSLNMRFSEINDPKGLCKDTSALGRWGNGDVEVKLNHQNEIPDVMGLIRQSLEQQLGN